MLDPIIYKYVAFLNSPIGWIAIYGSDEAVNAITFVEKNLKEAPNDIVLQGRQELKEYFDRSRKHFDVPVEQSGTFFQQDVWLEVSKVRYGRTASYGDISRAIGNPGSIRAVGGANGLNKLPIIIPCHRIIGSDGSLVGYTGGLDKKSYLLNLESEVKQLSLF